MRIGNKIFPYPTLNNNKALSEYKNNSTFELKLDKTENDDLVIENGDIVFKNIHFVLNNEELETLYDNSRIKCALIIECSSSLFRKAYTINMKGKDIRIPISSFKNIVYISAFLYADEDINSFKSTDFSDDYINYSFEIERFDILAIDDGFKFRIDLNPEEDNKVTSIFTIIRENTNNDIMRYQSDSDKIKIFLSPKYYDEYYALKDTPTANNIVFGILVIPVLSKCLEEIKSGYDEIEDIDEIIEYKNWFKSICIGYENITKSKLTIDEFREINSLELAQKVLNHGTCKGLKNFGELLFSGIGSDDYDE